MKRKNHLINLATTFALVLSFSASAGHHEASETVAAKISQAGKKTEMAFKNPCALPETTAPIIPDGNVASEDELVSAKKAMKAYLAEQDEYRICLDDTIVEMSKNETPTEDDATLTSGLTGLFNESVESSQKVADQFNVAVRAYKARQGSN